MPADSPFNTTAGSGQHYGHDLDFKPSLNRHEPLLLDAKDSSAVSSVNVRIATGILIQDRKITSDMPGPR